MGRPVLGRELRNTRLKKLVNHSKGLRKVTFINAVYCAVNTFILIRHNFYKYKKQESVGSLVGWFISDHLPLRDFGPYEIISMNVCGVLTVSMIM
jgi:hypothetical protein